MVTCELCGKQVKTAQALRGHKTFIHGITGSNSQQPVTRVATEQQVSVLEDRLQKLERVTGLRETEVGDLLNDLLSNTEPLTNKLHNITKQLSKFSDTVSKMSELQDQLTLMATRSETNRIATKAELLSKGVEKHERWLNPESTDEVLLEIIGGPIGYLEKRIDNLSSSRQIKGSG